MNTSVQPAALPQPGRLAVPVPALSDPLTLDAAVVVQALCGGPRVMLPGLRGAAEAAPWTHPSVVFIPAVESPDDALENLARERRRGRWVSFLAALALGASGFLLGAVATGVQLEATGAAIPPVWVPIDVSSAGLLLASSAGRVVVPVGGQLPNGDMLLAVTPERRTAVLASGTLALGAPAMRSLP